MSEPKTAPAQDYEARLKELLAPVNTFLETAAKDGIYLDLYLSSFDGGDAGTYSHYATDDWPKSDDASLTRVRNIELFDMNELWPEDGEEDDEGAAAERELSRSIRSAMARPVLAGPFFIWWIDCDVSMGSLRGLCRPSGLLTALFQPSGQSGDCGHGTAGQEGYRQALLSHKMPGRFWAHTACRSAYVFPATQYHTAMIEIQAVLVNQDSQDSQPTRCGHGTHRGWRGAHPFDPARERHQRAVRRDKGGAAGASLPWPDRPPGGDRQGPRAPQGKTSSSRKCQHLSTTPSPGIAAMIMTIMTPKKGRKGQ